MLTRAEYKEMMLDRFFWLLGQLGEAEHLAMNDIVSEKASRPPAMMEIARRHGANVNVVLAVFGWLPTQPSGGAPFVHVCDPSALCQPAYLLDERHRAAYVLFQDAATECKGSAWSPYPTVCPGA